MHENSAMRDRGSERDGERGAGRGGEGEREMDGDGGSANGEPPLLADSPPRSALELADALGSEMHNLRHLLDVLQLQRAAIATSDVNAINENIFAMRRLLLTLSEARRYRRLVVERLGAPPDIAPVWGDARDAKPSAPPPWGTASIQQLRDELQLVAAQVASEVEMNRQILHGVIAAGEELIRVLIGAEVPLFGVGGTRGVTAGGGGGPNGLRNSSGSEGALINRTI